MRLKKWTHNWAVKCKDGVIRVATLRNCGYRIKSSGTYDENKSVIQHEISIINNRQTILREQYNEQVTEKVRLEGEINKVNSRLESYANEMKTLKDKKKTLEESLNKEETNE